MVPLAPANRGEPWSVTGCEQQQNSEDQKWRGKENRYECGSGKTECAEWIVATFENHQQRKDNKDCCRETIRCQQFTLSVWLFWPICLYETPGFQRRLAG